MTAALRGGFPECPTLMQTGKLSAWENERIQSIRNDRLRRLGASLTTSAPAPSESIQRRNSALKSKPRAAPMDSVAAS